MVGMGERWWDEEQMVEIVGMGERWWDEGEMVGMRVGRRG